MYGRPCPISNATSPGNTPGLAGSLIAARAGAASQAGP
jgi:hypothetical protein